MKRRSAVAKWTSIFVVLAIALSFAAGAGLTHAIHMQEQPTNWFYQYTVYEGFGANAVVVQGGAKPNVYYEVIDGETGEVKLAGYVHNIITNAGMEWLQAQVSNAADGYAKWIALSTDTTTPAYTDTSLASEVTGNGLDRAEGTYTAGTASDGDVTWTVEYTFTYTGTSSITITKVGLFTDSYANGGTLFAEALLDPEATLAQNDMLKITWQITASN